MQAFDRAMVVAVTGVVAVGTVTLALAVAGLARPVAVAAGAAVVWAGLLGAWRHGPRRSTGSPGAPDSHPEPAPGAPGNPRLLVVLAGLVLVAVSGLHNLANRGEYVITDRDPGIYVAGGGWIAEHGDLEVQATTREGSPVPDLLDPETGVDGVVAWAAGQSDVGEGSGDLQIQGAHLFHALLAVGEWVGGAEGASAVPAVVGALALAAFFWLALRLLPDWLALVAAVALAVDFAWIYTVRSVLSEPTLLLVSFAAAVLLLDATAGHRERPLRLVVAGFVAASALTARVDAGVVLLAFPVLVALLVRRDGPGARAGRALGWWGAGAALPLVLAAVDLRLRSPRYLADLGSEVRLVVAGLVASTVAAVLVAVSDGPRWRQALARAAAPVRSREVVLAATAAALVVALAGFAWFVRPHLGPDRLDRGGEGWRVMESIQVHEGLTPDGTRTYAERSLDRIRWYTGPVAVAAGAAGLAVLAWRWVRGRLSATEWVTVGLVVPCLLLYVYAPSIYSDHPWMIRRYVPTAIPGLLLFSGVAAAALARWRRLPAPAATLGAVALAIGLVAYPLRMSLPLRSVTWQDGGRDGVARLCAEVGPSDVALLAADGSTALTLLPAVRSFCDVDAVGLDPSFDAERGAPVVAEVAERVGAEGASVVVVGPTREVVETLAPGAVDLRPVTILQTSAVGTTIGRPPSAVGDHAVTVWVGTVGPPVA
jgi:hypothetical protein